MRVLIVGAFGTVTSAIIRKFGKEGARIYALTGGKNSDNRYKKVYEQYDFSYDNNCIKEVFESVNPDVTIFTGAFDSNFEWSSGYSEMVKFGAGLYNCLNAFSFLNHGRFIFLSSNEVNSFDESTYKEILHSQRPLESGAIRTYARVYKASALKNGEDICSNYRKTTGSDVIALRIEELSFETKKPEEAVDTCTRMCSELLRENSITKESEKYSPIYITDVVEALYKLVNKDLLKYGLYRIHSDSSITQNELAELINTSFDTQVTIKENISDISSNDDIHDMSEEIEVKIFKDAKSCAQQIIKNIKNNRSVFASGSTVTEKFSKRIAQYFKGMLVALIPFIENMVIFIPFFMINNRTTGSTYFARLDCYLIYVLIFAMVYGQQQALFSSILAVCGYFFRQMYSRTGFEIMLDYNTYVWIAQLVILGLSVGYLRDQLNSLKADKEDEVGYLDSRLKDIEDINIINAKLKDELETQVINQSDSLGKIFEITSTLDKDEPEEVFFHAAEVVSKLMDCKEVAIYNVSNRSFARLMAFTSHNAKKLGNSIEYTKYTEMYETLKRGDVYINRKLEKDYPLMAAAIMAEESISSIIMLWDISWEQMNLAQSNRLRVVSYMIQNAVLKANRYIEMIENERYVEGTKLLETQAFKALLDAFINARKRGLADCSIIKINPGTKDVKEASIDLQKNFRNSDYLGSLDDGYLYVLLANTNNADAGFVTGRIKDAGYSYEMIDGDVDGGAYGD